MVIFKHIHFISVPHCLLRCTSANQLQLAEQAVPNGLKLTALIKFKFFKLSKCSYVYIHIYILFLYLAVALLHLLL